MRSIETLACLWQALSNPICIPPMNNRGRRIAFQRLNPQNQSTRSSGKPKNAGCAVVKPLYLTSPQPAQRRRCQLSPGNNVRVGSSGIVEYSYILRRTIYCTKMVRQLARKASGVIIFKVPRSSFITIPVEGPRCHPHAPSAAFAGGWRVAELLLKRITQQVLQELVAAVTWHNLSLSMAEPASAPNLSSPVDWRPHAITDAFEFCVGVCKVGMPATDHVTCD